MYLAKGTPSRLTSLPGNLREIFQSQAGVPDFKYQALYGDVVRVNGVFGVSSLTTPGAS